MDQAVICMARASFLNLISFRPLSCQHIQLPERCTFVLAFSGTDAKKIVDSDRKYNLRVLECKLAALMLLK